MDFDTQQKLTPHLSPGEHLLWTGRPKGGLAFHSGDLFLIPFSLVWSGLIFFFIWKALTEPDTHPFILILLGLFVVIGIHVLIGRFFYDAWRRSRTCYRLTEQRVLIVTGTSGRKIKSLNLKNMQDVSISTKDDGTGTITLGSTPYPGSSWMSPSWPGSSRFIPPALEHIPNARDVYNQILSAQREP